MHADNPFGIPAPRRLNQALPIAVSHTQAAVGPAISAVLRMAGDEHPRANSPGDTQRESAEHRRG